MGFVSQSVFSVDQSGQDDCGSGWKRGYRPFQYGGSAAVPADKLASGLI
ncbi:MAG: hypothetical protein UX87_C0037G0002 [Candidatus Amesbacteria bacterium GW2011_GWA1_47_16]|uniref:Uncharacterized protein n=1 Tax=Candidatus Amesbacteria bacterium GW2011_GWA1_47_16 TaxID=1618353 RepID=A0A0G1S0G5_9BACT|nr:MAG: hypothetical protein UX87_C0037G0002 [Candidatus Amesbacteria bacterium GW2011_GWA1_47_16]